VTRDDELSELLDRATPMVAAQLGCSTAEALERMQTLGEATETSVGEIARMVVDGDLRFDE
jgi:hypothetical protein